MGYVYQDSVRGAPRNALDVPSRNEDVLREQFAQTFEENPIMAVRRWNELREDHKTGPMLPAENARQRLKDAGLENDLKVSDAGITQAALDTLMFRKRIEKKRQEIFARAEGGLAQGAARLGLAFATTLADPISAGLNFVPVVGQVRYARWLAGAGSVAGRLGVRAGVGAAEGAAGAALYEPFLYTMRTQEQADYDAADSLLNVAFGGVVGAGLHTTVGETAELVRGTRDFLATRNIPRDERLAVSERALERRLAVKIGRDVDAAIREYAQVDGAMGGRLLNTDVARELSPDYRADRTRSAAVHEPSSYLVKRMYERKLAQPPKEGEDALVVFSGGGTGAGKTTGLNAIAKVDPRVERAQVIYDTNLNGLKSSVQKIEQALEADKRVIIVYTQRDPVDALVNGALPRAMRMGRTVPLEEHAKTHVESAKTIKELANRYAGDERVQIDVVDNSYGKGNQRLGNVADIPELEYNSVRENLKQAVDAQYAAGKISEAVYRGTVGKAPDGSRTGRGNRQGPPSQDGSVTAAERVAAASPEVRQAALRAAVGQAVEGRPINVEPILAASEGDDITVPLDTPDPDYRASTTQADAQLKDAPEGALEAQLQAAEEGAALAEAEAKELAKRLGVDIADDADMTEVAEAAVKAERWARAAELATVCLVRGG